MKRLKFFLAIMFCNESFIDDNMDAAITAKALDYLNK